MAEKPSTRLSILEAISSPLGFFVLALLIVEGFLSIVLVGSDLAPSDKVVGMYLGVSLFVLVTGIVAALGWYRPRNLTFDKGAHLADNSKDDIYGPVNEPESSPKQMGYNPRVIDQIGKATPILLPSSPTASEAVQSRCDALIVVDIQNDFFQQGALPVPDAESLVSALNDAIRDAEKAGLLIIFTQDWHSLEHSSFTENGGDWKPHCIIDTFGAALHPDVYRPTQAKTVKFGVEPELDGYSPFENPLMDRLINTASVARVYVAGIALEYCVYATCKDARGRNKNVVAVEGLIRAASPEHAEKVWRKLDVLGVKRASALEAKEEWANKALNQTGKKPAN